MQLAIMVAGVEKLELRHVQHGSRCLLHVRGRLRNLHHEELVQLLMRRTVAAAIGAVVFWAAHALETARWREWFAGTYDPWFLNSGRAMIFTLGCVCIASALVTWFDSVPGRTRGVPIGVGATAAMAATL